MSAPSDGQVQRKRSDADEMLRKIGDQVKELSRVGERVTVETAHKLGELVLVVQRDSRYGDAGVRTLAKLGGISRALLYRRARFAALFSRATLEELHQLASAGSATLRLGMLEELCGLQSEEAHAIAREAIVRAWTSRQVRSAVRALASGSEGTSERNLVHPNSAPRTPAIVRLETTSSTESNVRVRKRRESTTSTRPRVASGPRRDELVGHPIQDAPCSDDRESIKVLFLRVLNVVVAEAKAVAAVGGDRDPEVREAWRTTMEQVGRSIGTPFKWRMEQQANAGRG